MWKKIHCFKISFIEDYMSYKSHFVIHGIVGGVKKDDMNGG